VKVANRIGIADTPLSLTWSYIWGQIFAVFCSGISTLSMAQRNLTQWERLSDIGSKWQESLKFSVQSLFIQISLPRPTCARLRAPSKLPTDIQVSFLFPGDDHFFVFTTHQIFDLTVIGMLEWNSINQKNIRVRLAATRWVMEWMTCREETHIDYDHQDGPRGTTLAESLFLFNHRVSNYNLQSLPPSHSRIHDKWRDATASEWAWTDLQPILKEKKAVLSRDCVMGRTGCVWVLSSHIQ